MNSHRDQLLESMQDRRRCLLSNKLRSILFAILCSLGLATGVAQAKAEPALKVLGHGFAFPNRIDGVPTKLSDFSDLQIDHFTTNDDVKLVFWQAGKGRPAIFVPG